MQQICNNKINFLNPFNFEKMVWKFKLLKTRTKFVLEKFEASAIATKNMTH